MFQLYWENPMIEHDMEKILPHRTPMIFISDVRKCSLEENNLIAEADIKSSDILYQDNIKGVPAYAALEYMAQAIGCFIGHYDLLQDPEAEPGVGFVIGTRKLKTYLPVFKVNNRYYISVKSIFFDDTIASFDCKMYDNEDNIAAEAILNAYRPTDIETFMREKV